MIEPPQVPKTRRTPIAAEVHLRRSGEISNTVNAYDMSERGCKVEFVERPWLGETVWVKFDGLEFEHPIDTRVLETLLRRLS